MRRKNRHAVAKLARPDFASTIVIYRFDANETALANTTASANENNFGQRKQHHWPTKTTTLATNGTTEQMVVSKFVIPGV
jgi:hypothetical protein